MFSSLRYFVLITLLVVVIGAVSAGSYFKQIKTQEISDDTLAKNAAIIGSYGDTVWAHYTPSASAANPTPGGDFDTESTRFFRNFDLQKVTIFSPDLKRPYYSSTNAVILDAQGVRIPLFDMNKVSAGQAVSRVVQNSYVTMGGDRAEPHVLTQAIIPIFSADMAASARDACLHGGASAACTPIALVEIFSDITAQWQALESQRRWLCGTIVAAFLLLGSALLLTTARAEAIIARQHELNLELTAAAARAEAQSQDKSQFLASVSHELRTPLNAIIGFSEIVKTEAREHLQKVYLDYIEDIHASGKHLLSLINDILDFSKAEAGKLQIEWAETDITKVIRNSLRMVLPRAESAQVMLVEDIPSGHLIVTTDAKKLKQVLLNLLSNAVKFTPLGGEVRCQAWEDFIHHTVVIQVRDTGIGIAAKDIGRVMMPFGQVDSALSRKYEGTGLGLPIAKAFLESMGGEFSLESTLNVGTTITLTLPKTPTASLYKTHHEHPDVTPAAARA